MSRRTHLAQTSLLVGGLVLASCSSQGSGGTEPPAFTNLTGTRWNVTETVSAGNSCGVGIGVQDEWVAHVLAQSGNTVSIYDERSGSGAASNCTLSGYLLTCSAAHYPLLGCSSMSASYSVTLSSDASTLSGTATILCHDDMCTAPVNVSGTRTLPAG